MFLNEVMEERRKISNSENGPIWATPENLPFLKYEIYLLFSYSYGSKVPKWKCAHILLCKKYKNSIKLLKIADLQPPDWIQRKKTPCSILRNLSQIIARVVDIGYWSVWLTANRHEVLQEGLQHGEARYGGFQHPWPEHRARGRRGEGAYDLSRIQKK